ncbi:MAG: cation transporter [Thaumarchaeota archaeon]|nr:cation transporter [Nitrososphaerota archaeon]
MSEQQKKGRKESETGSCCPPKTQEEPDVQNGNEASDKSGTEQQSRWKGFKIGVTSGIIASACCIIPLILVVIFVLAGVGSITAALSFTQYRPYFLSLGTAFLLLSIYLHLKRKHGQFNLTTMRKDARFLLITTTVFAVFFTTTYFFILPGLSQTVYSNLSSSSSASYQEADITTLAGLHEVTLKVCGMTCEGCASAIEYALEEKLGVVKANVTYSEGKGTVIYNSTRITTEEISETITQLGYTAEILQDRVR